MKKLSDKERLLIVKGYRAAGNGRVSEFVENLLYSLNPCPNCKFFRKIEYIGRVANNKAFYLRCKECRMRFYYDCYGNEINRLQFRQLCLECGDFMSRQFNLPLNHENKERRDKKK